MKTHQINSGHLSLVKIAEVLNSKAKLELSEESTIKIQKCRDYLDKKIAEGGNPLYGITTGFGALYNKSIPPEDHAKLQRNLVTSHACGAGAEVSQEVVKLMLFLKAQGLSYGNSGVQLQTVQRLLDFYNNEIYPVVYEMGSLGASGDLAPLAHIALALIGLGEVNYQGKRQNTKDVLAHFGWEPIELQSKEGLALLNGTQFMSANGVWSLIRVRKLSVLADIIASISLDAYDGRIEPFLDLVHEIRSHKGQLATAKNIRKTLEGSELLTRKKEHLQDPYSFRCIPQVHGASKDVISYVAYVFTNEINSVTDNPTIFPDEDQIISAGNFHGQPLALALDSLAIALAELGSISERRTFKLIFGQRGLPPFLVANPGLNSGLMIPQYTAASMVSQNKQLCTPASVDSIDSSNGQEDHVSMGANAATKAIKVLDNLERILGIELMNAAQALEFRRPLKSSSLVEEIIGEYRKVVPFIEDDRVLQVDMDNTVEFLRKVKVKEQLFDSVI